MLILFYLLFEKNTICLFPSTNDSCFGRLSLGSIQHCHAQALVDSCQFALSCLSLFICVTEQVFIFLEIEQPEVVLVAGFSRF